MTPPTAPAIRLCNGETVHQAGSQLPEDAHGWTLVHRWGAGAWSTWLAPEDRERSREDYARLETEAAAIRTHAQADAAGFPAGRTLDARRLDWRLREYRHLWPNLDSPDRTGPGAAAGTVRAPGPAIGEPAGRLAADPVIREPAIRTTASTPAPMTWPHRPTAPPPR